MVRLLLLGFLLGALSLSVGAEEISVALSPVPAYELGTWAAGKTAFRLFPSLERPLERRGPEPAMSLFGMLTLGEDEYPLMFAVLGDNTPYLALDLDGDGVLSESEGQRGTPLSAEEWMWHLTFEVHGRPYELSIVWPAGRGFLFLIAQTAMKGEVDLDGKTRAIVLVDADVNGNYDDEGDFYVVDVDGDGILRGEAGEHEVFALDEAFTIGKRSFVVTDVPPDGSSLKLVPTEYVPPKVPLYVGAPAPDLSFESLQGEEVSLSQYRGKVVLLDFWASWCLPCVAATPKMKALYQEFHDRGLEIIGINLDLSREQAMDFIEHFELPWPQYWDGKGYESDPALLFRVTAIPMLYLIDQDGVIRGKWLGLAEEEVRAVIEELLGGKPEEETGPSTEASDGKGSGEAESSPSPFLSLQAPPKLSVSAAFEGEVPLEVALGNPSSHEAKEVSVEVRDLPPGVEAAPQELGSLGAGESVSVSIPLRFKGPEEGSHTAEVRVTYVYCPSEEVCYKLAQEAPLLLVVSPPEGRGSAEAPPPGEGGAGGGMDFPWLLLIGAGALLLLFLVLSG